MQFSHSMLLWTTQNPMKICFNHCTSDWHCEYSLGVDCACRVLTTNPFLTVSLTLLNLLSQCAVETHYCSRHLFHELRGKWSVAWFVVFIVPTKICFNCCTSNRQYEYSLGMDCACPVHFPWGSQAEIYISWRPCAFPASCHTPNHHEWVIVEPCFPSIWLTDIAQVCWGLQRPYSKTRMHSCWSMPCLCWESRC